MDGEVVSLERYEERGLERTRPDYGAGVMALAQMPEAEWSQRLAQLKAGKIRLAQLQQAIMVEGVDYGKIPGTPKPTLFKSGAEQLCEFYGLRAEIILHQAYGDGHLTPHIRIIAECKLHLGTTEGPVVGIGFGSCSSFETKYRYRRGERACPSCGTIGSVNRSKPPREGWYCWDKKGGCGAQFPKGDAGIEEQVVGNIDNPDPYDLHNTILKMAIKRALVEVTLRVTGASGFFTQDAEDLPAHFLQGNTGPVDEPNNATGPAPAATDRRVREAVRSGERNGSYSAASGAGNGADASHLTCSTDACRKTLTRGQHDVSVRAFGEALCPACQKERARRADAPGPAAHQGTQAQAPAGVREAGNVQGLCHAVYADWCELIGADREDRDERLRLWAHLSGHVNLASSNDLTPAEWSRLADGLQTAVQQEREAQSSAGAGGG